MPKDAQSKRLLKVKEAAAYTGLSDKRIRALVRAGELPYLQFEVFGNWWIDREDLNKWIQANKK